jgi:dihydropteroate synthase
MGVVNITPDSFSDGGWYLAPEAAVAHGLRLLEEGADLLDLGAESTRPGSHTGGTTDPLRASVSTEEEQARLLPVLNGILKARPDTIISVDTYKAATARAALEAGAEVVNDVSGFTWDKEMPSVCKEFGAGIILMHTRGRPDEWRSQPQPGPDVLLSLVRTGLGASLATALEAGIAPERIVLDPGYGFGKRFEENYALLARQSELLSLGRPLAAGLSRKSFLRHTMAELYGENASADLLLQARERASIAAMTAAILAGASIVRVHAVREAVEAAGVADAILAARPQ